MVINTISVQHQVSKATTEIPPKNDDSETQGDATGIAKTICASDEGENKGPIFNLIHHPLVRISFAQFYPSERNQVLREQISLLLESPAIRNLNWQISPVFKSYILHVSYNFNLKLIVKKNNFTHYADHWKT